MVYYLINYISDFLCYGYDAPEGAAVIYFRTGSQH
jgi:hypothetical protein